MPIEREKLEESCALLKRNLELYNRDISFFILIHEDGQRAQAIEDHARRLSRSRAGQALLTLLRAEADQNHSQCPGLVCYRPSRFLSLFKKKEFIAPLIINVGEIRDSAFATHMVYHLAYHGLTFYKQYKDHHGREDTQDFTVKNHVLTPKRVKFKESKQNLKADIFAAILTENAKDKENFIHKLAEKRVRDVFRRRPAFFCEKYPFPLVTEAVQLVYNELKHTLKNSEQAIGFALKMADEITIAYGGDAIQQWWDFCLPAQEMIWLDYPPETILGHAVFSAEDAYVRATAYLVSEYMGITASPPPTRSAYNPFSETERIAQVHKNSCEHTFQNVVSKAVMQHDAGSFLEEIKKQNDALAVGNAFGWCAHALSKSIPTFESYLKGQAEIEEVTLAFQHALEEIKFSKLLRLSHKIIYTRRHGITDYTVENLTAGLKNPEEMELILNALKSARQLEEMKTPNKAARESGAQSVPKETG